ncbi:SDR family NAD(P)-dependent oxidoreductase [Actinocrispum wychmicini]|uniref:Probable oxidoreductase n=1 Tax=Actinocrispum wychmicini TaxID=1213861 RepID=A0A4R2J2M0_9PSEU|nr:SDR family NAD(P)-dependent oxidoreductase [Actinocrispum wychmicini]TCO52621.1 NAD(P)-dependent dehydrogenase (short-subunit alcohol dehydrogenase family) [Actinocrispum wychmicini]
MNQEADEIIAGHDLTGKETIVTGGYGAVGYETAKAFAGAGARVVLAGRDQGKGEAAAAQLRAATGNDKVVFRHLDLASLESVTTWARKHAATGRPLHVLVTNAAVMAGPLTRTADGFESQFGVNHLAHFAFTLGLLPCLRAAGNARVVCLTSSAHRRGDIDYDDPNYERRPYDPWQAYGQSKTANALFSVGFTARHAGDGVTANAVMPGAISSGLQRHLSADDMRARGWDDRSGWKTPSQGAATSVWAAVTPELAGVGGRYLEDCAIATPWTQDGSPPRGHYLPYALDPDNAERLWRLSEELVG